jgi:hypothetical protein
MMSSTWRAVSRYASPATYIQTSSSRKTPDFGSIADSGFFSFPDPDLALDPTTTKKEDEETKLVTRPFFCRP